MVTEAARIYSQGRGPNKQCLRPQEALVLSQLYTGDGLAALRPPDDLARERRLAAVRREAELQACVPARAVEHRHPVEAVPEGTVEEGREVVLVDDGVRYRFIITRSWSAPGTANLPSATIARKRSVAVRPQKVSLAAAVWCCAVSGLLLRAHTLPTPRDTAPRSCAGVQSGSMFTMKRHVLWLSGMLTHRFAALPRFPL
ncbi:hypothetical protein DL768_010981 [Monosporascus sp. mg162]|nr:hypothetical protein DL768_010981 [Monosporascus sp. mg162]